MSSFVRQRSYTVPCKPKLLLQNNGDNISPLELTPNNTPNSPFFKPIKKRTSTIEHIDLPPPSLKVYQDTKPLFLTNIQSIR